MTPFTAVAIYLTIWWTVLFVVLPLGVTSHAEAGIDRGDGGDPGAPVDPKLKKKVVGVETIDHPSDGQLVAHARKYFNAADRMRT